MAEESPVLLPMLPTLLGLSIEYVPGESADLTFIGRRFDRPEACRLCPGLPCMHLQVGFCLIRVEGIVPEEDCPGFVLRGGVG